MEVSGLILFNLGFLIGGGFVWFFRQKDVDSIQQNQENIKQEFENLSNKVLLDNQEKTMSNILNELPNTFQTPTMAPFCKDEEKYNVVDELTKEIEKTKNEKTKIDNHIIYHILKINGVRFSFEDGSWGLIRASSNKPSLVIVTESPTSNDRKVKRTTR